MPELDLYVPVTINLRTNYPEEVQLDTEMFLVDTVEVPIYDRIRPITKDDIPNLVEGSVARDFATAYFAQDIKASSLILARVPTVAVPPAFICGVHETDPAVWAALGNGKTFDVTDSAANSDTVTLGDLAGVTALAQVIVILNDALAAVAVPTVVGLDSAAFALDCNGDIVLTMPIGQDDTDPTISIDFSAVATDIAYLLGVKTVTDGTVVPGNAIETLVTAYNAAKVLTTAYNMAIEDRGGNDTQAIALAAQIQTERAQMTLVDTSADAVDPALTTDLHSQLDLLGYDRTTVIFTEHSDYPDACADGAFLPATPATKSYGHTPLSGCLPSGSIGPTYRLSTGDRLALEGKGLNYVTRPKGYTFVHKGVTSGGVEKRMMLGKDWLETNIQNDVHALDMNQDLLAFDSFTLGAIKGILIQWLDEAVSRRLIISYVITMPQASDFSDAEKASGDMSLLEVFRAVGTFEAHTFNITGSIALS